METKHRAGVVLAIVALVLLAGESASSRPQATTAMGALAASMAPGTWAELTTTNIVPTLQASGASGAIFGYSEDGAWDPTTRQWFYVGNDHVYSTPLPFVAYSADTNAWRRMPQPSWAPTGPIHGYDHNAINPATGEFYFRLFGSNRVFKYHIPSATWTELPRLVTQDYLEVTAAVEYFPELGGLLWVNANGGTDGKAYLFSESTQQWTTIASGLRFGGYGNLAEYSPRHHVMVLSAGSGNRAMYKMDGSGNVTPLRDAPIPMGINLSILTVDPVTGDFLVFGGADEFWVYDVVTDTWTSRGTAPIFRPRRTDPYPVWHVDASPVSTYGVTMFVKFLAADPSRGWVYLYKHAAGLPALPGPGPGTGTGGLGTTAPPAESEGENGDGSINDAVCGALGVEALLVLAVACFRGRGCARPSAARR